MAYSTQRAVSDGTLGRLALAIDYFDRNEITVYYNGVVAGAGTWSWVGTTDKTINFNPVIANGVEVMVQRSTQLGAPLHQYTLGAQFIAETLDENFQQVLRIAQEAREGSGSADVYNDLDFHGYRVKNIGTAVDPKDAVSLGQYQADAAGAAASKTAAQAAEANALAYRNTANTAATNASTSEANALSYRNTASTHATNASTSAGQAQGFRDTASTHASNAATSATNAATSETNAATSASNAATSAASVVRNGAGGVAGLDASRRIIFPNSSGATAAVLASASTGASKTYTFPDATGTVALTSDLSSYAWRSGSATQDFTAQNLSASSLNSSHFAGFRNRLINGRFAVWQRGTSVNCPGGGLTYAADRWIVAVAGSSQATASYASFAGSPRPYPCDSTALILSVPAGAAFTNLRQRIEGVGTFQGQQITLTFWAKHISGSTTFAAFAIQHFGTGGTPAADVSTQLTLVGSGATTGEYTQCTFAGTVPAFTGKTLGSNGNDYLEIQIQTVSNLAHTIGITAAQVEPGAAATPFEFKPNAVELAMCQRYFRYFPQAFGRWETATNAFLTTAAWPDMRAAPTSTVVAGAAVEEPNVAFRAVSAVVGGLTASGFTGALTTVAASAVGKAGVFTGSSASGGIHLSAEL